MDIYRNLSEKQRGIIKSFLLIENIRSTAEDENDRIKKESIVNLQQIYYSSIQKAESIITSIRSKTANIQKRLNQVYISLPVLPINVEKSQLGNKEMGYLIEQLDFSFQSFSKSENDIEGRVGLLLSGWKKSKTKRNTIVIIAIVTTILLSCILITIITNENKRQTEQRLEMTQIAENKQESTQLAYQSTTEYRQQESANATAIAIPTATSSAATAQAQAQEQATAEFLKAIVDKGNSNNIFSYSISRIVVDPEGIIYVGTWGGEPGNKFGEATGLYKSSDGGKTWFTANNGLDALNITDLDIVPDDPNTLYVSATDGSYNLLYVSRDKGNSWERYDVKGEVAQVSDFTMLSSSGNKFMLHMSDYRNAAYLTEDGGISWKWFGMDPWPANVVDYIYSSPANYSIVFSTGAYGKDFYKSIDGGYTWTEIEFKRLLFTTLAISDLDPNLIYAYGEEGISRSIDGLSSWEVVLGGEISSVLPSRFAKEKVYAAVSKQGLFVSNDEGENWTLLLPESKARITAIAEDINGDVLLGTDNGIWRVFNKQN